MRRTIGFVLPMALLLSGCATRVEGIASPGPTYAHTAASSLPGGAVPSCLAADGCSTGGNSPDGTTGPLAVQPSCETLNAAVQSFGAAASAVFPRWQTWRGTQAQLEAIQDVVTDFVQICGYKVMTDVADHYAVPASYELFLDANAALGPLFQQPGGLRCADLKARGYSAKDAVDYWFFWGSPDLMDVDLNGTPCETVFADVALYMPAYY